MTHVYDPKLKLRSALRTDFGGAADAYENYAQLQHSMADIAASLLAERLRGMRQPRVVDLGCGTGYALQHLHQHFPQVQRMGIDIAHSMCQRAVQRTGDAAILCADMSQLPLRNGCVDGVISSAALQWSADTQATFTEWARVVRPGGWAAVATFGPATLHELRTAFAQIDRWPHVQSFAPRSDLVDYAQNEGWNVVHAASHMQPLMYPSVPALMRQLRAIGARNKRLDRRPGLLTPRQLAALLKSYPTRGDGSVAATWEVVILVMQREGTEW